MIPSHGLLGALGWVFGWAIVTAVLALPWETWLVGTAPVGMVMGCGMPGAVSGGGRQR